MKSPERQICNNENQISSCQGPGWKWRLTTNGHACRIFVDGGKNVQFYKLTKHHWNSHLQREGFILCKPYFNKAVFFLRVKQANSKNFYLYHTDNCC